MKLDFMSLPGEKLGINPSIIKSGHRAAIETQSTRRKDEIDALQRAVAKGRFVGILFLPGEPAFGVGPRI
jgi:hypothetical protein